MSEIRETTATAEKHSKYDPLFLDCSLYSYQCILQNPVTPLILLLQYYLETLQYGPLFSNKSLENLKIWAYEKYLKV